MITYQEIKAWTELTGHRISGWEAEALRTLSGAYLAEHQAADDPKRLPPYRAAPETISREAVAERVESIFDRLMAQDAKAGVGPAGERTSHRKVTGSRSHS